MNKTCSRCSTPIDEKDECYIDENGENFWCENCEDDEYVPQTPKEKNTLKMNYQDIYKKIKEVGDFLNGKLPPSPYHPKGRNSYAHVFERIINKFGCSYKLIKLDRYEELLEFIEWLRYNGY